MTFDFLGEVQLIVGPLLNQLGFEFDAVEDIDEGGRRGIVAFYRSSDCKIQIYLSSREGEINCMIAPADAPNEYGLVNRANKWQYLTRFARRPNLPLRELAELTAVHFDTDRERVEWVRDCILQNFDSARTGIIKISKR